MKKALKRIYKFLLIDHEIGFMRFCYAMLIPCAIWEDFCRWWMWFMCFILVLSTFERRKNDE